MCAVVEHTRVGTINERAEGYQIMHAFLNVTSNARVLDWSGCLAAWNSVSFIASPPLSTIVLNAS